MVLGKKEKKLPRTKDKITSRHFYELGLKTVINCHIRIKGKIINKNKSSRPLVEFKSGDDYTVKTGQWSDRKMTIDRENKRYSEVIVDKETGKIIHICDEKLSQHKGHGSAKYKNKQIK